MKIKKNEVLCISKNGETLLEDNRGFLLCFDNLQQISDYCWLHCIPVDDIYVYKLNKETGKEIQVPEELFND